MDVGGTTPGWNHPEIFRRYLKYNGSKVLGEEVSAHSWLVGLEWIGMTSGKVSVNFFRASGRTRWFWEEQDGLKAKTNMGISKNPSCHVYIRFLNHRLVLIGFSSRESDVILDVARPFSIYKFQRDHGRVHSSWQDDDGSVFMGIISFRRNNKIVMHKYKLYRADIRVSPILVLKFFFDTSSSDIISFWKLGKRYTFE